MGNKSSCKRGRGGEHNNEISVESADSGLQDRQNDVEEGMGKSV